MFSSGCQFTFWFWKSKDRNRFGFLIPKTVNYKKALKSLKRNKSDVRDKIWRKFHSLSVFCQLDFFDRVVKAVLLHGSDIWGFSNDDIIKTGSSYKDKIK